MIRYLIIITTLSGIGPASLELGGAGFLLTARRVAAQTLDRNSETHSGDRRRSGGPRESDPFFEAMREVHLESSSKELFDLLRHASIRQEINLKDADADRLHANGREAFKAIFAIRKDNQENQAEPASKDELKRQIREVLAPLEEKSFEILQQSETDFKRLLGIYAQARGYRAILNDKVAEQIGLQGEELDAFRKFRHEQGRAIMEDTRRAVEKEIRNTPPGSSPRAAISKLFRRAEEQLDENLGSQLSAEQLAAFEALKGSEVELPERLFSFAPDHRGGGRSERHRGPRQ